MSKALFPKKRARYALDAGSFEAFVDQVNGQSPKLYKGNTWRVDVAVCLGLKNGQPSEDEQIVDLAGSGYDSLTLEVKAASDLTTNLMAKTVTVFDDTLTAATWLDYTQQHAKFEFTATEANIAATTGTPHVLVISAIMVDGSLITFPVSTLTVLDDYTPSGAADPETNPGNAISLSQADSRYARVSADADTAKHGMAAVGNGVSSKAITFTTPFASAPVVVLPMLAVPSGGAIIECTVDQSTISTTGFTAVFGAATPNANYKLHWQAFLS